MPVSLDTRAVLRTLYHLITFFEVLLRQQARYSDFRGDDGDSMLLGEMVQGQIPGARHLQCDEMAYGNLK